MMMDEKNGQDLNQQLVRQIKDFAAHMEVKFRRGG
jgi:hypothetical protein